MNKRSNIVTIVAFLIVGGLVLYSYNSQNTKKSEFAALGARVDGYASTTESRVKNSLITLPDGTILVGLKEGIGEYTSESKLPGKVTLEANYLKTEFIPGEYKKADPRLDAIVPMYVSTDSHQGGSKYIVLFNDRGDAALEKSYARLGARDVQIESIDILQSDTNVKREEYKVDVHYKLEGTDSISGKYVSLPREVIIPVIDGHFDPKGTVSK